MAKKLTSKQEENLKARLRERDNIAQAIGKVSKDSGSDARKRAIKGMVDAEKPAKNIYGSALTSTKEPINKKHDGVFGTRFLSKSSPPDSLDKPRNSTRVATAVKSAGDKAQTETRKGIMSQMLKEQRGKIKEVNAGASYKGK